jgi:hypothetical protein
VKKNAGQLFQVTTYLLLLLSLCIRKSERRGGIPMLIKANYINALAVSISPIFEPAGPTLGELFFSLWVNFFMTFGEIFKSGC